MQLNKILNNFLRIAMYQDNSRDSSKYQGM